MRALTCAILAATSGILAAQSSNPATVDSTAAYRARVSGIVKHLDGSPWKSAKVTLVSLPFPALTASGPADIVRTDTDENGKFSASILRRREYTAWGIGPTETRFRVTSFAEGVASGSRVELVEAKARRVRQPIRITGLERWKGRGPFRARVLLAARNRHAIEIPVEKGSEITIPPLPGDRCTIEVLAKDERPVTSSRLTLRDRVQTGRHLDVGQPTTTFVEIRDEAGNGIEGASIYRDLHGEWSQVATSEKDGVAKISSMRDPTLHHYFVEKGGFCMSMLHNNAPMQTRRGKWHPLRKEVKIAAHATLQKGRRRTGRILIDGKPLSEIGLVVQGVSVHVDPAGTHYINRYRRVVRTDATGGFEITGLSKDTDGTWVGAILRPADVAQLPRTWRRQLSHYVNDILDLKPVSSDRTDIDLARFCPIILEFTDTAGLPLRDVRVALGAFGTINNWESMTGGYLSDPVGRIGVLVRPSLDLVLAAQKNGAFAARRIAVHSKRGDDSIVFLRHQMGEPHRISGKIVTESGKPVAGMTLSCYVDWSHAMVHAIPQEREAPKPPRAARNSAAFEDLDAASLRQCVATLTGVHGGVQTDAGGRFEFRVPAIPLRWRITGHKKFLFLTSRVNTNVDVQDKSVTGLSIRTR